MRRIFTDCRIRENPSDPCPSVSYSFRFTALRCARRGRAPSASARPGSIRGCRPVRQPAAGVPAYSILLIAAEVPMPGWLRQLRRALAGRPSARRPAPRRPAVEPLEERALLAAGFLQTNMVSDIPGLANVTDANLKNPWGLTMTGEFWVSDNTSGVSTLYNGIGTPN